MILPLILAQLTSPIGLNLNDQPIIAQDEGVTLSRVQVVTVNCAGAGVTCTQVGTKLTVTVAGGGGGAPTSATYITQTPDATLTNEQALSALATGIVVNTTATGVLTIYTGATCTNQFIRSLSASGAATCASVNLASDVTGLLPDSNLASSYSGVGACAANQYAHTLNDNAAPTCAQVAYSQVSGTPTIYNQTIEDEATPLTQRTNVNFTGAGVSCADSGGKTVCTISGGGSGSANVVEQSVALSGGSGFFSQVVTGQSWVTTSSEIVCGVLGTTADSLTPEVIGVAGLIVAISKRRKPTLHGAVLRAVPYAKSRGGTQEEMIRTACLAVIREDEGDNGKRDWPDARIRQEVQRHFP